MAVSKTKPVEAIQEAYDAGHKVFGENYVQVSSSFNMDNMRRRSAVLRPGDKRRAPHLVGVWGQGVGWLGWQGGG